MEFRPILSTLMRHKTAAALIVLEIALTCAIICNAMFLIGQRLAQLNEVSGLAENELVRVQITGIGNDPNAEAQTRADLAALRAIPGVTHATVINQVPFVNSSWNSSVRLSADQQQAMLNATVYMAEDQFLEALGLKLVAGRDFNPDEYLEFEALQRLTGEVSVPGAIITRKMAERLFPGEDAIGKTFYSWGDGGIRVVGVVEHLVRPNMLGGPTAREYSMVFPIRSHYGVGGNYVLRTSPERRDEVLKAAVETLRGNGPPRIVLEDNTMTVEAMRDEFFQQQRSMAWLLAIVCIGLLLITALGIVGLASFWVQQRTKQIGVRRALGATRAQVMRYFQTENFLLATIGIAIGMLAAFGINQVLMERYELERLPLAYLPVGALALWLLGQLAVFGPARRAASVPPAIATRSV
ncbi:putative ABC transport system permease protein [Luteimonas sp. J16]|uniref:ABC transporter permease n=1 Tax=unclassified Luteimonas TaxID=2629088 RepID=UPI000479C2DE|nr:MULTISPECIES: FtsX-like permease family protein [unclassified Luteimonas]TWG89732.1 putative ABC transport system permease protein [Luteimonas sp. J16]